MNQKERFLTTLLGSGADRFPYFDLEPDDETVSRWRGEGLPRDTSVAEHFQLEPHHSVGLSVRSSPFYKMAADLLHDPDAFRRHYDPDDPERYGKDYVRRCRRLDRDGRVVYVDASGGGLLQMLGVGDWASMVEACYALIEQPRRVDDLMARTAEFHCVCLERVLGKVNVDYASVYEPIAANTGPVISPEMFRRYAMPGYRKVISLLESHGVALRVMCTTGGDLSTLLPPLIDAGINCLWISNIMSSNMAYSKLRKEYGRDVALIGGIDATALLGDAATLRRTVEDTVSPLLADGRYLPCLDDRPRSNVPFASYSLYREILADVARRG